MKFKNQNLREIAEAIIGDSEYFPYRSSSYITQFFEECDLDFVHDGSTRWSWTVNRIVELLQEPQPAACILPEKFVHVLRVLMYKSDAQSGDPDRTLALSLLNKPLTKEGYEAFYGEDDLLYIRHIGSKIISLANNSHRPFTQKEIERRCQLSTYLDQCSEDELIEEVLLPLFRQLGYQSVRPTGHKDKALEYGKDIWMKYVLPTQHIIYFGIQVKKDKLDSAGQTRKPNANIAEIHNQVFMLLGHEIFDSETSKKVLVDHVFLIAGGEITKQARNWIGQKLSTTQRSQILFMDRENILDLYIINNLALPKSTVIIGEVEF